MEPILHSFTYSLDYLREMIADVPEDRLTAQPTGVVNHPAWTIGHLVFISQEIGRVIGVEPWLDEDWAKQFGPGSNPSDLSTGPHAPRVQMPQSGIASNSNLLAALSIAQTKLTAAVAALSDAQLDDPFPDPSYADVFPSIRHALTQVLLGHTAFHVGQTSVWRRAMKFSPIGRSYE
jgi:hypothetical protein